MGMFYDNNHNSFFFFQTGIGGPGGQGGSGSRHIDCPCSVPGAAGHNCKSSVTAPPPITKYNYHVVVLSCRVKRVNGRGCGPGTSWLLSFHSEDFAHEATPTTIGLIGKAFSPFPMNELHGFFPLLCCWQDLHATLNVIKCIIIVAVAWGKNCKGSVC